MTTGAFDGIKRRAGSGGVGRGAFGGYDATLNDEPPHFVGHWGCRVFCRLRFDDGAIEPTEATARLIAAAIENGLAARGFRRVRADSADFFVHFHVGRHTAADTLLTRRPTEGHVANTGDGSWGGYGRPESIEDRTITWEEGMLIVDALNAQNGRVAWRGVVVGDIRPSVEADPGPAIRDAVGRLLRGFP